ncbi:MAG: glycoside hydrolase family 57 protein, partial [Caldisericaceae bacterium]
GEDYFLEENWLYEAITETYLPLYISFERLRREGVRFHLTMSFTPPLVNMLQDDLLMSRYKSYLASRMALLDEIMSKKNAQEVFDVLSFYKERLRIVSDTFENVLGGNIVSGFKKLQEEGLVEVITCTATHEILPLEANQSVRSAQVKVGVQSYKQAFGKQPDGIWLGECAYTEGVDKLLSQNGIKFTILDTHGLLNAVPAPVYGIAAPVISKSGVAFFGRDPEASKQVWSAQEGYPGDFNYREFYRDVAYDLTESEVKEYLHPAGFRFDSGIKLHKITGKVPLGEKQIYNRQKAEETAQMHAGNFLFNREREAEYLESIMDREPLMVAPFDTELFGHWWFEGPDFLEDFFRKAFYDSQVIETISLSGYLDKYPFEQIVSPASSTWGDGGYFKVWLNDKTDWIYAHLNVLGKRMTSIANSFKPSNLIERRVLNQMAKEVLLADSSDWAFLITVGTAVDFATSEEKFHINAFNKLYEDLLNEKIDEDFLDYLEQRDSIFGFIDYTVFKNMEV